MDFDPSTRPDDETKPAQFAKANERQFSPAIPTLGSGITGISVPVSSVAQTDREKFSLENNLKSFEDKGGGIIRGVGNDGKMMITNVGTPGVTDPTKPLPVANSIDLNGSNEIMARANKARGEMIDMSIAANGGNGVAMLGDGGVEASNAEKSRRWAIDSMLANVKSSDRANVVSSLINSQTQQRGQDLSHAATISAQGITSRGQDLNALSDQNRNMVVMRGQDIGANTDAQRIGIDRRRVDIALADQAKSNEKWGIEKNILQGQLADSEAVRTARSELASAISSGDQAKIAAAKEKATAAGIRFDKPNNEFTAVTDNMGMNITRTNKDTGAVDIIDGKTGKIKSSIPAPGQRQSVSIDAFAAQIRAKNPGQTITDEQIAAAYKSQFGAN